MKNRLYFNSGTSFLKGGYKPLPLPKKLIVDEIYAKFLYFLRGLNERG